MLLNTSSCDALIYAKKDAGDWRPWRKMSILMGNCERRPTTGPNLKKVNPQKVRKFRTKRRYGKPTQKNIGARFSLGRSGARASTIGKLT